MQDYNKNGYHGLSILVIDMLDLYKRFYSDIQGLVDTQLEVLKLAEERDLPVINLRYSVKKSRTIREISQAVRKVRRHRFLVKPDNDGFKDTALYDVLQSFQTREVFLMGFETSFCVLDTAKGAKKRKIRFSSSRDVTLDVRLDPDMFDYNGADWLASHGNFYQSYQEHLALR